MLRLVLTETNPSPVVQRVELPLRYEQKRLQWTPSTVEAGTWGPCFVSIIVPHYVATTRATRCAPHRSSGFISRMPITNCYNVVIAVHKRRVVSMTSLKWLSVIVNSVGLELEEEEELALD